MDGIQQALDTTCTRTRDMDRKNPLLLERGRGATFTDAEGRSYVDFTSCTGAAPLGMGHPRIVEAVTRHLADGGGILPGTMSRIRVDLALRLLDLFPHSERVAFMRTGSCATSAAVRLARAATGKNTVLTSGYHGWHDWQLQYQGDARQHAYDPRVHHFGYDADQLLALCREYADDLAAVVVSPEHDVMPTGHLEELISITHGFGGVAVLDEVMTGFRVGPGGLTARLDPRPDITVLSKGLANGTALSAVLLGPRVAGAHEATDLGNTYLRETTPFVVALESIDLLAEETARVHRTTASLGAGLNEVFSATGYPACAAWDDGILHLVFATGDLAGGFYRTMLDAGLFLGSGGTILPGAGVTDDHVALAVRTARTLAEGTAATGHASPFETPDDALWQPFADFCADAFRATPSVADLWWTAKVAAQVKPAREKGALR
ncbi:aminotransferase class III-fold pyridoxal phosphate-dependent enzyme [Nocardiopsis sp. NPDC006198]|uniref:aminotransferase class III-fold pyridoxal phosphate-dependent enzyme n=1 Tax=Nocardiopsis sp. NPDC006198 TaxID=3154472 RepID=UPI0033A372CB